MARKKLTGSQTGSQSAGDAAVAAAPKKARGAKAARGRKAKGRKKATAAPKTQGTRAKVAKKAAGKRSPGPGADWIHTSPAEIQAFRTEHGLTEAATARALGVSVGTLRNWTLHGKSAMAKMQKSVKKAIAAYRPEAAATPPKSVRKPLRLVTRRAESREPDSALVAEMVIGYIRRGGEIRGDLVDYIERVKRALIL